MGVDSNLALMVSFGTSLAIIIPTSITGAYKHNKELQGYLKVWNNFRIIRYNWWEL